MRSCRGALKARRDARSDGDGVACRTLGRNSDPSQRFEGFRDVGRGGRGPQRHALADPLVQNICPFEDDF